MNEDHPYIIEDHEQWPIHKLYANREEFVKEVTEYTVQRILDTRSKNLSEEIALTLYKERTRTRQEPWKVDPPHEITFWNKLRRKLVKKSLDKDKEQAEVTNEEILRTIVNRYAQEIAGGFNIKTYRFARRFLTAFFNRLLNTAANRNFKRIYSRRRYMLKERFKRHGETELMRKLSTKGTLVVVPTHFSNLDSIMLGWAMDSLGIAPVSYGAGLNLYNNSILARFMNRLGAYKVDRRKKNPIYLETLKTFSTLSIQHGTHTLFFPGGTRERSGMLEKKLKMGLLGTVTEAQRSHFMNGKDDKIFIIPLVIGYNFVLEAKSLISDHLKRTGKELYMSSGDRLTFWKMVRFMWRLFSVSSEIQLSFGRPLDVMGNFVDKEGNSLDQKGNIIDLKGYFTSNGELTVDLQRDQEYTRRLADIIVDRYHRENIVLSSHVVAFTAFNILKARNPRLDLYGLLRLPNEDRYIPYQQFHDAIAQLKNKLLKMADQDKLKLSSKIRGEVDVLIENGLQNLGVFHPKGPLKLHKHKNFHSEDMELLFYYHNKLVGYNLEKTVNWSTFANIKEEDEAIFEDLMYGTT